MFYSLKLFWHPGDRVLLFCPQFGQNELEAKRGKTADRQMKIATKKGIHPDAVHLSA